MNRRLRVQISETSGFPYAIVSREVMWELVEHLSIQRVKVSYTFDSTHFYVYFLSSELGSAQQILDSWADAKEPALAPHA